MTTIKLSFGSSKHKSWVAEITGKDAKFGFARKFINIDDRETDEVTLANGVYQINGQGASDFYEKAFIVVKDGEVTEIESEDVLTAIEEMNAPAVEVVAEPKEETLEDIKAEGRKLTKEIYESVPCKQTKAWSDHYITGTFTFGSDINQMRQLRDKLKNEKQSIIDQFKKAYNL